MLFFLIFRQKNIPDTLYCIYSVDRWQNTFRPIQETQGGVSRLQISFRLEQRL